MHQNNTTELSKEIKKHQKDLTWRIVMDVMDTFLLGLNGYFDTHSNGIKIDINSCYGFNLKLHHTN